MAEDDPYHKAATVLRRVVGWATGGGRQMVLMAWAFNSALFLAAQWLFALRLGFRPDEIGIGPAASVAHATVGFVLVLLAVGSLVMVIAGMNHVVALLTAFTWELAVLARDARRSRLLAVLTTMTASGGVAIVGATQGDSRTATTLWIGAAVGVGLLLSWALLGGARRAEPFPLVVRWEVSWLGGMVTATALMAVAAYLDITGDVHLAGTIGFTAGFLVGSLIVAVTLAVLSSGSPAPLARWLPSRDKPGVIAVGTALLTAVIVGLWTITSAVHDARVVPQGHVPGALGRFIIGIPVQCVDVTWLHDTPAASIDRPLVRLGTGSTTLLVEPGSGVMRLPTGAVQTTGRKATDCVR